MKLALFLTTWAVATAAGAQPASYGRFGSSCPSPATSKPPALVFEGVPRLGRAFTVGLDDGVRASGTFLDVLLTGSSNTLFGPLTLPLVVAPLAPCPLRVSPDVALVLPRGALLSFSFTVPNNLSLQGLTFYQQWIVGWTPLGGSGLAFGASDGGVGVVGV